MIEAITGGPQGIAEPGRIWAIVGDSEAGPSRMLQQMETKNSQLVAYRHHFRNLSNTTEFYYQQRFNSSDSGDAPTVSEYLSSIRDNQGTWTKEKIISRFRLEKLANEQLIKLSNGETKRVLIAAALMHHPDRLLLDHPLTGLDQASRADISLVMQEISRSGIEVIVATGPYEIPESVTDIAIMHHDSIEKRISRNEFSPERFGFADQIHIDNELLDQLLSSANKQVFETIVEMKAVTIQYDDKTILENINWKMKQGERWSLSGSNGAGKSTLLSLINGDNPQAYSNDIILFDRKRGTGESIWDIKRNTGFVSPELYQYFPVDSSCLQVIESGFYDTVGLFRASQPEKEKICSSWMELMHIDGSGRKLFNRVSPSVQRLCLLARALVKNPPLLILDEPTQGLDYTQQQFFTRLIDMICDRSDVSLIFVSHFREHIPKAVNHSIQLENGRILYCG